jgi:thioredoxin reductase
MVTEVQKENNLFKVKTSSGKEFFSKYVILAT